MEGGNLLTNGFGLCLTTNHLTAENMQRLTAAMAATRSRVDAVMAAVRVHDQKQHAYGRQGRANSSNGSVSRTIV